MERTSWWEVLLIHRVISLTRVSIQILIEPLIGVEIAILEYSLPTGPTVVSQGNRLVLICSCPVIPMQDSSFHGVC